MSAELDIERARREAAEKTATDATSRAEREKAARESAEQSAKEAQALLANERAKREAAEIVARDANSRAAEEKTSREHAEVALKHAVASVASVASAVSAASVASADAQVTLQSVASGSNVSTPVTAARPPARPPLSPTAEAQPAQAGSTNATTVSTAKQSPSWIIPIAIFAIAGILFVVIASLWTSWENNSSVKTDDAYVRADVTPLSTKVSGIVRRAFVTDYQNVKAGDNLVELKNDEYKARVDQATEAVRQSEIKLADMKQRKEQQDARVLQAKATIDTSRQTVKQANDSVASAKDSIAEANALLDSGKATLVQSQAAISAAKADFTRAKLERTRQENLLATDSVTKAHVEIVVNEFDRASANLDGQVAAQSKAQADLVAKKALLAKAKEQLTSAMADKEKSLLAVQNHQDELVLQQKQRELLDSEQLSLASDVTAKKAGLVAAQTDLDYTSVRAPQAGTVGELKVKPGQLVSAGTQVITIVSSVPWLIANYRETQLANVSVGDPADISIDAVPGKHFKGHVERIAPASGAQFSLLPADNASGNFTKVIQRIPVKIRFEEGSQDLSSIRPGVSAVVTILPGHKK